MCQTFDRSCKFIGMFPEDLRPELLMAQGEAMGLNQDFSGPTKERTSDTVSLTHNSLQPNDTYSDNSPVSNRTGLNDHFSHKSRKTSESSSRKIRLGHDGYIAESSHDVAAFPRQDLSYHKTSPQTIEEPLEKNFGKERAEPKKPERDKKDRSGLFHTSTTGNKKPGLPNESNTAAVSEPNSDGCQDAEKHVETEKLVVNIPADTDMATDVRAYSQWPGMHTLTET